MGRDYLNVVREQGGLLQIAVRDNKLFEVMRFGGFNDVQDAFNGP